MSSTTSKARRSTQKRKTCRDGVASESSIEAMKRICGIVTRASLEECLIQVHEGNLGKENVFEWLSQTLPERCTKKRRTVGEIPISNALVKTGPFASLDAYLTGKILRQLPFLERVFVMNSVCKGWSSLITDKEMWRDVALDIDDAFLSANDALQLLKSTIPPQSIKCLSIHAYSEDVDSRDLQALIKDGGDAFEAVESLDIRGHRFMTPFFVDLGKQIFLRCITSLSLENIGDKVRFSTVVDNLLRKLPNLVVLRMNFRIARYLGIPYTSVHIEKIRDALAEARNGGTPLLTDLSFCRRETYQLHSFSISAMATLGSSFPELQRLDVPSFLVSPVRARHGVPVVSVSRLPRLLEVDLKLENESRNTKLSAGCVNSFLSSVARAMPSLESLGVALTRPGYSQWSAPLGGEKESVVTLRLTEPLSCSLRKLFLKSIHIDAISLSESNLGSLESLEIDSCGDQTFTAINAIAAKARNLKRIEVYLACVGAYGREDERMTDVAALSSLDAPVLRTLILSSIGQGVTDAVDAFFKAGRCTRVRVVELHRAGSRKRWLGKCFCGIWRSRKRGKVYGHCILKKIDLKERCWRLVARESPGQKETLWAVEEGVRTH